MKHFLVVQAFGNVLSLFRPFYVRSFIDFWSCSIICMNYNDVTRRHLEFDLKF